MVLFGAIASQTYVTSSADDSPVVSLGSLAMVGLATVSVHLIAFAMAVFAARRCGLKREEQIAVGIAGSQKTLMVGLQIAIDCGVSVLPMMIYHAGQLVMDTFIVDRWKRTTELRAGEGE